MNLGPGFEKQQRLATEVIRFLRTAAGLRESTLGGGRFQVCQLIDNKKVVIDAREIDEVIPRSDVAGDDFIQVNFLCGKKILMTKTLIGFKPSASRGLAAAQIPRVVTTPDVLNVFEAIQDAIHLSGADSEEVAHLKRIFEAVVAGGETVGFDLSTERAWLSRISLNSPQVPS